MSSKSIVTSPAFAVELAARRTSGAIQRREGSVLDMDVLRGRKGANARPGVGSTGLHGVQGRGRQSLLRHSSPPPSSGRVLHPSWVVRRTQPSERKGVG